MTQDSSHAIDLDETTLSCSYWQDLPDRVVLFESVAWENFSAHVKNPRSCISILSDSYVVSPDLAE